MADLAVSLVQRGYKVFYVAQHSMSAERKALGWLPPALTDVTLLFAENDGAARALAIEAGPNSIHLCQGVRANGIIKAAQTTLEKRGLQYWAIMETVDDSGMRGLLKRIEYRRILKSHRRSIQGILANGHSTADWFSARGFPRDQVFPFAYFLPTPKITFSPASAKKNCFRFIFVGQFIQRKRIDWLINSLAKLKDKSFELWIVGTGACEIQLKLLAEEKLGQRVRWVGQLTLPQVPVVMSQADCLVLPSLHDGWGAVASEALMIGTPVICSEGCGVAGVVRNSGCGGVFATDNFDELTHLLARQIEKGQVDEELRRKIIEWSDCLNSTRGAEYLHEILKFSRDTDNIRPAAPWSKPAITL